MRKSNSVAIGMYEKVSGSMLLVFQLSGSQFGYAVFRRVINYYSGEEDALDMRKAMPRDAARKSMVPLTRPIHPHELGADFCS